MDESITIRLSANSTSLTSTYSPVINVNGNSEIALVWLKTYKTIVIKEPKRLEINESNNCFDIIFYSDLHEKIKIPPGFYKIDEINDFVNKKNDTYKKIFYFSLTYTDNNTKCRMNCDKSINFDVENSLASVLGFEKKIYNFFSAKDLYHQSEKINYVTNCDSSIKVMCNIAKGSFDNEQHSRSIFEFLPQQSVGTQIVESPINLIYYKLKTAVIKTIKIDLVDEENKPIANSDKKTTVILHIRPIKS